MADGTGAAGTADGAGQGTGGVAEGGVGVAGELIRAAGALLWRDGPGGSGSGGSGSGGSGEPEFAVAHRPRYDDWSFPKGKLDRGEHVLRAAVREVEEETGLVPRLGRRLPTAAYRHGDRPKQVDYWAARAVAEAAFTPNEEVDELVWLPADQAEARLSYPDDVALLHAFLDGPRRTRPLIVVRHGTAGDKHAWREPDELRPLDERGRAQATALAALLHSYGPARLFSSATSRCLETVLPYARRIRAEVVTDAAFTVGESGPGRGVERLLALLRDGDPAVVCTHGENVSELVTGLCREMGEKVPEEPGLRKGEFWVAHIGDGVLAALERHTPLVSGLP